MNALSTLGGLALLHLMFAMVPGPNTLVVSHLAASLSRRHGVLAALGVAAASVVWVAASLAGVGLLLLEAGWLYRVLRILGAVYLVHVGVRLLAAAARPAAGGAPPPMLSRAARHPFLAGAATTLSNPKSAVFWTSLFIVAVPPGLPGWFEPAVLGVVAAQSAGWYALVALALSTGPARRAYGRAARWLDGIAGLAMTALGIRLALEVRSEIGRLRL
ncbi:MAG: LysE family translocator [Alphaproteobacteria bacterium]